MALAIKLSQVSASHEYTIYNPELPLTVMPRLLVDSIGEINLLSGARLMWNGYWLAWSGYLTSSIVNKRNDAGARMLLGCKLGRMTLELKNIKKLLPIPKDVRDIEI